MARAAVPNARRALDDPDPEVRIAGVRALELLAAGAGEAIPDLAGLLADPVASVRVAALEALSEHGPYAATVAPLVAERLAHGPSPEERASAAFALGNLGAQADHLDVLLDALLDDLPAVQAAVAHAIMCALEDEREHRREIVSRALHRLSRKE